MSDRDKVEELLGGLTFPEGPRLRRQFRLRSAHGGGRAQRLPGAGRPGRHGRAGGRIDRSISTGPSGAYACMLGGEDRLTLFICTNTGGGPAAAENKEGKIEIVRADVPGAGLP